MNPGMRSLENRSEKVHGLPGEAPSQSCPLLEPEEPQGLLLHGEHPSPETLKSKLHTKIQNFWSINLMQHRESSTPLTFCCTPKII